MSPSTGRPVRTSSTATTSSPALRGPCRAVDRRRGRVQLAPASSTGHLPADGLDDERDVDGSVTGQVSDHDHVRAHEGHARHPAPPGRPRSWRPGVRLFNRTETTSTFSGGRTSPARVHVDECRQSFFPTDVHMVADHASAPSPGSPAPTGPTTASTTRRGATSEEPRAVRRRGPDRTRLVPQHRGAGPSYMCVGAEGGVLRRVTFTAPVSASCTSRITASHRARSSGRGAMSTFGWAWDANLSDDAGPYVEHHGGRSTPTTSPTSPSSLPARRRRSVSSGTRTRARAPCRRRRPRPAPAAARSGRMPRARTAEIAVVVTRHVPGRRAGEPRRRWRTRVVDVRTDIVPGTPFTTAVAVPDAVGLRLTAVADGTRLLSVSTEAPGPMPPISTRRPSRPPRADIATVEEALSHGPSPRAVPARHPLPEPYWREALPRPRAQPFPTSPWPRAD